MNLIITGHHFDLTEKHKSFISYKTQAKLQNFDSRLHKISIIVTQEKYSVKTECIITSDFGEFFASATEEQMEASLDQTLAKISSELKKKHDKLVVHR